MQELAKFEMDVHNIIINQIIFPEEGETIRNIQLHTSVCNMSSTKIAPLICFCHV